jgi:hypothetical protein
LFLFSLQSHPPVSVVECFKLKISIFCLILNTLAANNNLGVGLFNNLIETETIKTCYKLY